MRKALNRKMLPPLPTRPTFFGSYAEGQSLAGEVFTRASSATYFDSSGNLQTAGVDVPRWHVTPGGLIAPGRLYEPTSTNSLRNNSMQNAVAGSPGTAPDNWIATGSVNNLTQTIVGTGTVNNIDYIDVRVAGTPNTGGTWFISFEGNQQIAALLNQVWSASAYIQLVGGSLTNLTNIGLAISERDAAGAFLAFGLTTTTLTATALNQQYYYQVRTLANASTAFVRPGFQFDYTNAQAIDITFRIGMPQIEQSVFPTSVIRTTTVAVARAADAPYIPVTALPGYNTSQSTIYFEGSIVTLNAGSSSTAMQLDGGSNLERITMYYDNSGNRMGQSMFASGGATQVSQNIPTTLNTTTHNFKVAIASQLNNSNSACNGTIGTNDTSCVMPTAADKLWIGRRFNGLGVPVIARKVGFWPTRLPDAFLGSFTT